MSGFAKAANAPMIGLVLAYRTLISPWKPRSCRFEPTCSQYALEALRTHPLPRALWLTVSRIARCQPLCRSGHDPVPPPRR